ncbi:hypothetical protein SynBIOSE41_00817 [Synechococcus sp. BIOS-E4-1]|uniref:hypothetical protein n=1 Tax=Synechococcus sp. BIOS-E4-1 TaxID=1400864 RepID=UPI0016456306|nr:hypothetical protein [Synechococcus sp. BIOS-E4-1]QNI53349.1 hypothetical protein SynBIOSE41_00817 [Synechococcus sp. BIOS-E4-1]
MTLQKNHNGEYVISPRKAGPEAAAFGTGFAPDINADGSMLGFDGLVEGTSGGLITYAIYTAVLTFLDTEKSVKSGQLTRDEQREIVLDRTWECTKGAVPTVIIISCLLAVFPFLGWPAFLAGLIGGGVMATRITRAVFDALSEEQRQTLVTKAKEAEVTIKGLTDVDDADPAMGVA